MERSGQGSYGRGLYIPRDPNAPVIYDAISTGPPSLYVDPASVRYAPFDPHASPLEPQQLPYQPRNPDLMLENQPIQRG